MSLRPDSLLEFFARHYFAGMLKQDPQDMEGLNLKLDPDAVLAQFTGAQINLKVVEAQNLFGWPD